MPLLPREERAQDQAGPGLKRLAAIAPLALFVALGAYALVIDLSLSSRLPSAEDWAEAAAALRARGAPGDGLQIWPPWAERARVVVDELPVFTEEDLARADYVGVKRLWLLALRPLPRAGLARAQDALRSRGAAPLTDELRWGGLSLQPWDLRAREVAADLTAQLSPRPSFGEVDFVAHRCVRLAAGARLTAEAQAGRVLHLRAGIEGDKAYDLGRPGLNIVVDASGFSSSLTVKPVAEGEAPAWQGVELPLPDGPERRTFSFAALGPRDDRQLCFAAWTTR